MDTGCEECVAPEAISSAPLNPSEGSRRNQTFSCADGGVIPNRGEKVFVMHPEHAEHPFTARFQITDVTKALFSVAKIVDQNNEVVFNRQGGYIRSLANGERTWFEREGNTYVMHWWAQEASQQQQQPQQRQAPFPRQDG